MTSDKTNHIDFWNLAGKMLSHDASKKEETDFKDLISDNDDLREIWEKLRRDHALINYTSHDTDAAWALQKQKIITSEKKKSQQLMIKVMAIAAMCTLLIGVAFWFTGERSTTKTITSTDNIKTIELPDGSTVTLNAGGVLKFDDYNYNITERKLTLFGEAFFEVKKSKKPFIVKTDHATVTVLGTAFNVKQHQATEVYVTSGKVNLSTLKNERSLLLEKGQMGVVEQSQVQLKTANANALPTRWLRSLLKFENVTLYKALSRINQVYGITYDISTKNENCLLTANYSTQSLDEILISLSTIYDISVSENNRHIIVNSCN